MQRYEFGGRRGCCAFAEIISAFNYEDAVTKAKQWCEDNNAEYEYCIAA